MSASADGPNLTCGKCGAPLQRVGKSTDQCVACLLELAWDEEEVPAANAERFDHYQVAIHADGRLMELGRGAMGVTFKAFDTVLGNEVALKVIDARIAAHPEARARFRTLLVLDGLEPLQNPPGPQEGRLREPSLQALLRELAAFNTGLCVITTRTPVADIADQEGRLRPAS